MSSFNVTASKKMIQTATKADGFFKATAPFFKYAGKGFKAIGFGLNVYNENESAMRDINYVNSLKEYGLSDWDAGVLDATSRGLQATRAGAKMATVDTGNLITDLVDCCSPVTWLDRVTFHRMDDSLNMVRGGLDQGEEWIDSWNVTNLINPNSTSNLSGANTSPMSGGR
ncbi:MAG: hypothetical protein JNK65_08290 [Deltaproteobacteria bacterium]|nr:hypothetical protein [Deltaproteobacteria bacterium]